VEFVCMDLVCDKATAQISNLVYVDPRMGIHEQVMTS